MKVLVINPIMYTSETKNIKRADSIKDTMMYDLCLAFHDLGHEVILIGGEPFKPIEDEEYPFEVLWFQCRFQKLFMPHCLPFMPEIYSYVKHNRDLDLIITSEVFSVNSLLAYRANPKKVLIWHELAKHNSMMRQIPSKIWYGLIAKVFMRNAKVVARSKEANEFIRKYCKNTDSRIIDHGVNIDKFVPCKEKTDSFVVCSQLIERKQIDGIICSFSEFVNRFDYGYTLYIIGEGNLEQKLRKLVSEYGIEDKVIFTGRMTHEELLPILARAKAMLVNTRKDNNMVSIVESVAVGTPVVTTEIPLNASYIKSENLGIARNSWGADDLNKIVINNENYVKNCLEYRYQLSTKKRVDQFLELMA